MRPFSPRPALLALAGMWIIAVGGHAYPEVRDDVEQVIRFQQLAAEHPPVIPAPCSEERAKASPAVLHPDRHTTHCWMEFSRFEQLYPEVAAITDKDASARVIVAGGEVLENPVERLEHQLWDAALLAFGPPLLVALGFLLWSYWRRRAPSWTWAAGAAQAQP
jgi:hypothetical protein